MTNNVKQSEKQGNFEMFKSEENKKKQNTPPIERQRIKPTRQPNF